MEPAGVFRKRTSPRTFFLVALVGAGVALGIAYRQGVFVPAIDSRVRALEGENEYENMTDGYAVPIPTRWRVFTEELFPERRELSISDIRGLMSTCGQSCAAFSIVTLGDMPSDCREDACPSAPVSPSTTLTIYGFANPANVGLDAFLEQALFKSVTGGQMYAQELDDGSTARMEFLTYEDDTQLRSYYFTKGQAVYWLDQQVLFGDRTGLDDLLHELQRTAGLFELRP